MQHNFWMEELVAVCITWSIKCSNRICWLKRNPPEVVSQPLFSNMNYMHVCVCCNRVQLDGRKRNFARVAVLKSETAQKYVLVICPSYVYTPSVSKLCTMAVVIRFSRLIVRATWRDFRPKSEIKDTDFCGWARMTSVASKSVSQIPLFWCQSVCGKFSSGADRHYLARTTTPWWLARHRDGDRFYAAPIWSSI